MSSHGAWRPCPRCFAQMPGDREICEVCDAKEKGLPIPERPKDESFDTAKDDLNIYHFDGDPHDAHHHAHGKHHKEHHTEHTGEHHVVAHEVHAEKEVFRPPRPKAAVESSPVKHAPRLCRMALISLLASLAAGPLGILLAVVALRRIHSSHGQLKGETLAWFALVVGAVWLVFVGLVLYFYLLSNVQGPVVAML